MLGVQMGTTVILCLAHLLETRCLTHPNRQQHDVTTGNAHSPAMLVHSLRVISNGPAGQHMTTEVATAL